jgi:hypothetical protein
MGFLDTVKVNATKLTEQAKQQTVAAKEKYDDSRLQKKVNELYAQVGRLTVASRRGEAPPDADAQIGAKANEIAGLERQIAEHRAARPPNTPTATPPPPPPSPA